MVFDSLCLVTLFFTFRFFFKNTQSSHRYSAKLASEGLKLGRRQNSESPE